MGSKTRLEQSSVRAFRKAVLTNYEYLTADGTLGHAYFSRAIYALPRAERLSLFEAVKTAGTPLEQFDPETTQPISGKVFYGDNVVDWTINHYPRPEHPTSVYRTLHLSFEDETGWDRFCSDPSDHPGLLNKEHQNEPR